LDYICDPKKTDEKILISSFHCAPETADMEFQMTLSQGLEKGNNLAFHLIQSFRPGETTAETAHLIGKQLTENVLQGKHEYVLTTHVDKGHIHNHVIFCATSFVDRRKFVSNRKIYHQIRKASDQICQQFGLSIIMPGEERGKGYKEYLENKSGTSWKSRLRDTIDEQLENCRSYEELLLRMSLAGFDIKEGKYLAFRAQGQQRFTRSKTLGSGYSEEGLKRRIRSNDHAKELPQLKGDIRLILDLRTIVKAMESPAYGHVIKINNLKIAAKTLNYLTAKDIDSYTQLADRYRSIQATFDNTKNALKAVERRMIKLASIMKHLNAIERTQAAMVSPKSKRHDDAPSLGAQSAVILHDAAIRALASEGIKPPYPSEKSLLADFEKLDQQKEMLYLQYRQAKIDFRRISTAMKNVEHLMSFKQEQTIDESKLLTENRMNEP
jgi:hypothetical protein